MRKFLIGCGVTLGVLLLLGIVGIGVLVNQIKKALPDLEHLESQREELAARFGSVDEFVPPLDGRVEPERMEIYLAVRQTLPRDDTSFLRAIDDVASQEQRVKDASGLDKVQEIFRIAQGGIGVARVAMEYLARRDSVLLVEGMGPGEYVHFTALGPILGLHHHPEPCAPELVENLSSEDARSMEAAHESILVIFRDQLINARRELRGMELRSEAQDAYLAELELAFEQRRIGDHETIFADGLPLVTLESLSPYWDRLKSSLPECRETWSLELLVATDEDDRGIQIQFGDRDDD